MWLSIFYRYRQIPGDVCDATEDDYFNTDLVLPCPKTGTIFIQIKLGLI